MWLLSKLRFFSLRHKCILQIVAILCRSFGSFLLSYFISNISKLSLHDEWYSRNTTCVLNLISTFYYYHWVDTSASGLLVPDGVIRPVVSAEKLTWFTRYIHYWNWQFLVKVFIIKTKILLPQVEVTSSDVSYIA